MTELEPVRAVAVRRHVHVDADALIAWSDSARAAAGIAKSLARTPFVPDSLRDRDPDITAGNVTAAILTGVELGLTPMAALRSIDVIKGTPSLRAIALRALVLNAGHELIVEESTATRAIVRGRRRGQLEWQTSRWTLDRARTLNLLGRDQWRQQPTAMLVARATAECARLIAADVLLAIPYVAEELDDGDAEPDDAAPVRARRTAQRRTATPPPLLPAPDDTLSLDTAPPGPAAPAPVDEPPLDDTPTPEPDVDMITDAQMRAVQAGFRDLGIKDRAQRLTITRQIVGRDIDTAKDLYRLEASTVIDDLAERKRRLDEDEQIDAAYEAEQGGDDA
jgi:hypothetical protein